MYNVSNKEINSTGVKCYYIIDLLVFFLPSFRILFSSLKKDIKLYKPLSNYLFVQKIILKICIFM